MIKRKYYNMIVQVIQKVYCDQIIEIEIDDIEQQLDNKELGDIIENKIHNKEYYQITEPKLLTWSTQLADKNFLLLTEDGNIIKRGTFKEKIEWI